MNRRESGTSGGGVRFTYSHSKKGGACGVSTGNRLQCKETYWFHTEIEYSFLPRACSASFSSKIFRPLCSSLFIVFLSFDRYSKFACFVVHTYFDNLIYTCWYLLCSDGWGKLRVVRVPRLYLYSPCCWLRAELWILSAKKEMFYHCKSTTEKLCDIFEGGHKITSKLPSRMTGKSEVILVEVNIIYVYKARSLLTAYSWQRL